MKKANLQNGVVYDVASMSRLLELPLPVLDHTPCPRKDSLITYYGGWDFATLKKCVAGKPFLYSNDQFYNKYIKEPKFKLGYYEIRDCWQSDIERMADDGWALAPISLAAPACLAYLEDFQENFFEGLVGFAEKLTGINWEEPPVHTPRVVRYIGLAFGKEIMSVDTSISVNEKYSGCGKSFAICQNIKP